MKNISIEEFYQYYIRENHSRLDTIKYFNMSESQFRKYVVKNGLKKNTKYNGIRYSIPSYEELYEKYIIDNMTSISLSEYYKVNHRTLTRWLKKYNISKTNDKRLENVYLTNFKKYGSKTKFGTNEFKEWRKQNIDVIQHNIEKTFIEKYGVTNFFDTAESKDIWKMGTSKTEFQIYDDLKNIFPNVIRQYKSTEYPFNCDFYIPDIKLYIEYQGFYTHGGEPFDENNKEHIIQKKALENDLNEFNKDKLYIWCTRDVLKRTMAKNNGLNFIEFFSYNEFKQWTRKSKECVLGFLLSIDSKHCLINQVINGVYIDYYIPSRKIAIKFQGYNWGIGNPKNDTKLLMNDGIRLINIYDYEWFNYQDNFKLFLKNVLKARDKKLLRNNVVEEISNEEFINFIKDNHLFGDTIKGCHINYGIKENGELIAVSGFNKRSGKYNWEWKRFAIKYGWMTCHNVAKLFLDEFSKNYSGILVDYQQMDRFPFSSDEEMGFTKINWNSGVVSINSSTMKFTRHSFLPEKPLNKLETMEKYGFDKELPTSGTITWIKRIE